MVNADRPTFHCRVCAGNETSATYEAREMMFGLRTKFHYAQCFTCGSLSLVDPPTDYAIYYSADYYSFSGVHGGTKEFIKALARAKRDAAYFDGGGLLGRFLARHLEDGALLSVSKLGLAHDTRILDVGCGRGKLLYRMSNLGFTNLSGVDPFLHEEIGNENGIRIRKAYLEDLPSEKYDLLMFHHSLEHVEDPRRTLLSAARVLSAHGKCLVRLPVLSYAWERYGTDWVQLSPPRHLWIPTEKAMADLADFAGFRVEKVEYDSTPLQFWGSELCQRDIPLNTVDPLNVRALFRIRQARDLRKRAEALNFAGRGDQAVFHLRVQRA